MIDDVIEIPMEEVVFELGAILDEQSREIKALQRQVRALRRAIEPLLDGLNYRPRATHYYLRVDHPGVKRLERVYRLTAPKEDKRG